jgi:hypothetical protein
MKKHGPPPCGMKKVGWRIMIGPFGDGYGPLPQQ